MDTAARLTTWARTPPLTLLVDRDADTRRMYSEYLQLSACRTEEAADGREALAIAIAHHPDAVVTETRLPGISGFDLCTLLRRDDSTRTIPIVVVTGDAFDQDIRRAKDAGADSVLVKPCLPETLVAELARVIGASVVLRERGRILQGKLAQQQLAHAEGLIELSRANKRRTMLSRAHNRHDTIDPAVLPPTLVCPSCDSPLIYQHSHIGGVSERHVEQWDYFSCTGGCGMFQYRQRTRKLRKV